MNQIKKYLTRYIVNVTAQKMGILMHHNYNTSCEYGSMKIEPFFGVMALRIWGRLLEILLRLAQLFLVSFPLCEHYLV
jgi:hypothetical protein